MQTLIKRLIFEAEVAVVELDRLEVMLDTVYEMVMREKKHMQSKDTVVSHRLYRPVISFYFISRRDVRTLFHIHILTIYSFLHLFHSYPTSGSRCSINLERRRTNRTGTCSTTSRDTAKTPSIASPLPPSNFASFRAISTICGIALRRLG